MFPIAPLADDLLPVRVAPIDPEEASEPFEALAFISSPWHRLKAPLPPSRRYAELVLEGAEIRGLPEEYVEWLRRERDSSRSITSGIPPSYYATRSRAASRAFAGAWAVALIGLPVAQKFALPALDAWSGG